MPSGLFDPAYARSDSFKVRWYTLTLAALGEERLTVPSTWPREVYRFLWIRSFHPPVMVRIAHGPNNTIIVTSELVGESDDKARIRRDSTALPEATWRDLRTLLQRERFWQQPFSDTSRFGLDGARWVIEGLRNDRYTIVDRWTPQDTGATGFVRRIGLAFLNAARVSVPPQELY